jgi:hypothetical protein
LWPGLTALAQPERGRQETRGSLIVDTRTAVDKTTTILDSIERNPTRFIFGNKTSEGVKLR